MHTQWLDGSWDAARYKSFRVGRCVCRSVVDWAAYARSHMTSWYIVDDVGHVQRMSAVASASSHLFTACLSTRRTCSRPRCWQAQIPLRRLPRNVRGFGEVGDLSRGRPGVSTIATCRDGLKNPRDKSATSQFVSVVLMEFRNEHDTTRQTDFRTSLHHA